MQAIGEITNCQGVWRGPAIDYMRDGLHVFTARELAEIDSALRHLLSRGEIDFPDITPDTFPLDTAGAFLTGLRKELRFGRGFIMLRGIPRDSYSADDMARIYLGIGSYIGAPMIQSYLGDLLGHVMDVSDIEPKSRGYRKGGGQNMHVDSTDMCDIVGLMCLKSARRGGASRISSTLAVYNAVLAERPDLAEILCRGYFFRRTEEDGKHATRVQSEDRIAGFAQSQGEVSCYVIGAYIQRAAANGGKPLSKLEQEALDAVQKFAASEEFYLDMSFADGDIQFLNNRIIFHGRTNYEDYKELAQRRHLMRLWLKVPDWPALPPNQVFSTREDQESWQRNRHKLMELPSVHLHDASGKVAALHGGQPAAHNN